MEAAATTTTGIQPVPSVKEAPSMSITLTNTFAATVSASDAADAIRRVGKYVDMVDGFRITGKAQERSARHGLWAVEVENLGGNANDCWVVLTSYGISPAKELGSSWQTVKGLGC